MQRLWHGRWTARIVRTAEAALLLDAHGLSVEAAPLLRSMLEHSIALHWLVDRAGCRCSGPPARTVPSGGRGSEERGGIGLAPSRARPRKRLDGGSAVDTDPDTLIEDHHLATKHRAKRPIGSATFARRGYSRRGRPTRPWLAQSRPLTSTKMPQGVHFIGSRGRSPVRFLAPLPWQLHSALHCYQVLVPGRSERWARGVGRRIRAGHAGLSLSF